MSRKHLAIGVALIGSLCVVPAINTQAAPPTCLGKSATIVGTNRSETIIGTGGDDVIVAKGGNDKVYGKGGNDIICGGGGRDKLYGNNGRDKLIGGPGNDQLYGANGGDVLEGQKGFDYLAGGQKSDKMVGGDGNDLLDGGADGGTANGGPGVDACFSATVGDLAGCEPDILWDSTGPTTLGYIDNGDGSISYTQIVNGPEVDGVTYLYGVGASSLNCTCDYEWWEYNLSRDYRRFTAVVGQDDLEDPNNVLRFNVYGDGSLITSETVGFGETKEIIANVTNVLRLRIEVAVETYGGTGSSTGYFLNNRIAAHPLLQVDRTVN